MSDCIATVGGCKGLKFDLQIPCKLQLKAFCVSINECFFVVVAKCCPFLCVFPFFFRTFSFWCRCLCPRSPTHCVNGIYNTQELSKLLLFVIFFIDFCKGLVVHKIPRQKIQSASLCTLKTQKKEKQNKRKVKYIKMLEQSHWWWLAIGRVLAESSPKLKQGNTIIK